MTKAKKTSSEPAHVDVAPEFRESVEHLASAWPKLPPHIREAIMMLADLGTTFDEEQEFARNEGTRGA